MSSRGGVGSDSDVGLKSVLLLLGGIVGVSGRERFRCGRTTRRVASSVAGGRPPHVAQGGGKVRPGTFSVPN